MSANGYQGEKKRLAVMPHSVLLPRLGDISQLVGFGESLRTRLETVQSAEDEGAQEDVRKRLGEEGMLIQVLQWLNVGEPTESE